MARVAADYEQFAVPAHELAILTDAFHARSNFHRCNSQRVSPKSESSLYSSAINIRQGRKKQRTSVYLLFSRGSPYRRGGRGSANRG